MAGDRPDPEDAYELHVNLIRHGRDALPSRSRAAGMRAAANVPLVPQPSTGAALVSPPPAGGTDLGGRLQRPPNEQTHLRHLRAPCRVRSRSSSPGLPSTRAVMRRSASRRSPANLKAGQALFKTNCGTCHTLYAAGTDGNYGPDLDELLAPSGAPSGPSARRRSARPEPCVLNALEHGVDTTTTPGRMPAGILNQQQAQEVADFVAHTAGEG